MGERTSCLFFLIQKYGLLSESAKSSQRPGTSLASCEITACLLGTLMNVFLWCFQKHGCDSPDHIPELPSGRELYLLNLFCFKNWIVKNLSWVKLWILQYVLTAFGYPLTCLVWPCANDAQSWKGLDDFWDVCTSQILPVGLELSPSLKEQNKLWPRVERRCVNGRRGNTQHTVWSNRWAAHGLANVKKVPLPELDPPTALVLFARSSNSGSAKSPCHLPRGRITSGGKCCDSICSLLLAGLFLDVPPRGEAEAELKIILEVVQTRKKKKKTQKTGAQRKVIYPRPNTKQIIRRKPHTVPVALKHNWSFRKTHNPDSSTKLCCSLGNRGKLCVHGVRIQQFGGLKTYLRNTNLLCRMGNNEIYYNLKYMCIYSLKCLT